MKIILIGLLVIIIFVSGCVSDTNDSDDTNESNNTTLYDPSNESINISELHNYQNQTSNESTMKCKEVDGKCCIGEYCSVIHEDSCALGTTRNFSGCDDNCLPIEECSPINGSRSDNEDSNVILPDPQDDPNYVAAHPDPEYDNFTWTLPTGASEIRLSLMADIDDFLFNEHGNIGGWGKHAGGHVEGLDHAWIELKPGRTVKSMADGVVKEISKSEGEYHIYIDYGHNLIGIHMEIMTPYVELRDRVTRGQEIGIGMSFDPHQSSAEMGLIDRGRTDGVLVTDGGGGSYVSVFDYLEDDDKRLLVDTYIEKTVDPYMANETNNWMFDPEEPYLTNEIFLHRGNEGKIVGTWYLISEEWEYAYPNDIITFIEADNPYFTGNVVRAIDDQDIYDGDWYIGGNYEVDYTTTPNRFKITQVWPSDYYGIFEVIEGNGDEHGYDEDRATLRIEYDKTTYPSEFSDDALLYIQRTNIGRREDT